MPRPLTFGQVTEKFLAHKRLYLRSRYLDFQFRRINRILGKARFDAIGVEDLEGFFRGRLACGIAGSTCNHNRKALSLMYDWAIRRGFCKKNPVRELPKFRAVRKQGRVLTRGEFRRIYTAANPDLKFYLLGLWWTGGRKSETLRLRWRDFNPAVPSLTFPSEATKSGKSRTVPVPLRLYDALMARREKIQPAPDDPIFTSEGRPVGEMRTALETACQRAGMKRFYFHTFRRSFASHASDNAMPLQMLQDLLGHSRPEVTRLYITPGPGYLRKAASYLK